MQSHITSDISFTPYSFYSSSDRKHRRQQIKELLEALRRAWGATLARTATSPNQRLRGVRAAAMQAGLEGMVAELAEMEAKLSEL